MFSLNSGRDLCLLAGLGEPEKNREFNIVVSKPLKVMI